jgi:hypothetical protein
MRGERTDSRSRQIRRSSKLRSENAFLAQEVTLDLYQQLQVEAILDAIDPDRPVERVVALASGATHLGRVRSRVVSCL